MYDKTVRRRRAVLGLLVASSLILLTAYFGESAGGGLHSVQRGVARGRLADPGGREPGAQAGARPLRLGRRHLRRQGRAQGPAQGPRRAARAGHPAAGQAARERPARRPARRSTSQHGLADNRPGRRARHRPGPQPVVHAGHDRQGHVGDGVRRQPGRGQRRGASSARSPGRRPGTSIVTLVTDHTTQIGATVERERRQGDRAGRGGPPDRPRAQLARRARTTSRPAQTVVTSGTRVEGRQVPLALPAATSRSAA